ncbi:MAG TPA: PQQ-binding-like beta-propeller repeat protein, partial [Kribbella sp.]
MRILQRGICLLVLLVGAAVAPASAADPTGAPMSGDLPPLADMPFYRSDPNRSAIQPGPGPAAAPELAWQQPLSTDSHFLPILVDGAVIGGTNDGLVVAVDAHTGAERWRFTAAGPVGGSAGAANGLVYFGDTHSLFALDVKTGTQRWVAEVPSAETRPLVVDGVVYTAAIGGVLGFDASTGKQVWHWAGPQVPVAVGSIADGVLYSMAGDGRVYAIDIRTSTEKWHVQTIGPNPGYPEVVGDTVYAATVQGEAQEPIGELYAIDRETGIVRWRFRSPTGQQISAGPVKNGILYANSEFDGIYALRDDGGSASVIWHVDAPRGYWPTAMVGDTLYQQRRDGSVGAYALGDGALEWETSPLDVAAGGPVISGGMVF